MGRQPTAGGPSGEDEESSDETGLSDAVRERLVRRLAADLGMAWNHALTAGADPRRLIGRIEAARRHIRAAPRGRAPVGNPGSGAGQADRELPD